MQDNKPDNILIKNNLNTKSLEWEYHLYYVDFGAVFEKN